MHPDRISSWKCAFLAFFASRAMVGINVYAAHSSREYLAPVVGGWEGVSNWWLNPWTTFDSLWYLRIAAQGYQEHTTVFFPLYPLLLRLGGPSDIGMALAGVIISNVCFLVALYLLFRLTALDHGEKTAHCAVWLLAFFPATAFFSAVYTESLFLVLILLCFLNARRRQWVAAGFWGLLAALTRNPGFLLALALLLEYRSARKLDPAPVRAVDLACLCLPLLGFAGVQLWFWHLFGPLAGVTSQQFFYRSIGWPWLPVWKDLMLLFSDIDILLSLFIIVHLVCIALPLIFPLIRRGALPASYLLFTIGILMMHLIYQRTLSLYTLAVLRYMATAFPFTLMLALCLGPWFSKRSLFVPVALGYVSLGMLFCYGFGMKLFQG